MSSAGQRRILAGRYRLGAVLGRGGMSTVYRATDSSLDREVAVKVAMDPLLESDPVYAARFKREARAAAALNHPGVVTIFDAGADGPTRYIVMEYVEGQSLAEILRDQGPLEPSRAALIAEQIADTLSAAHAAGIVHRDIKPGNVMVGAGDRVKVLDFGIARTPDGVSLTQTASVLGTAPYMAPEQAMGNPADARSDIYSLGCVLYEMLTGKPPFMADVPAAVLHQHVRVPVKPPREVNPAVPPALNTLVVQMLAKKPEERPQTAIEVRDRLASFEAGPPTDPTASVTAVPATAATEVLASAAAAAAIVPQVATVPEPASAPPAASVPPPAAGPTRPLPPARKKSAGPWAVLAVIALLLLGAAVAYALVSGSGSGSSQSGTSATHHSAPPVTSSSVPANSVSHSTASSTSRASSTPTTPTTPTTTTTTTTTSATTTPTTTLPGPAGGAPPTPTKKGKPK